jgi:hypothetical protein
MYTIYNLVHFGPATAKIEHSTARNTDKMRTPVNVRSHTSDVISAVTVSPLLTTVGYGRFFDQMPRLRSVYGFPITAHGALPSDTFGPVFFHYQ